MRYNHYKLVTVIYIQRVTQMCLVLLLTLNNSQQNNILFYSNSQYDTFVFMLTIPFMVNINYNY